MIIGDGIMLGAGGESASIFVTGLSQTDTVTATKDGKTIAGKWVQKQKLTDVEIPPMTSNTEPNGECLASSVLADRYAYKAFDVDTDSSWVANAVPTSSNPQWIQYKFDSPVAVTKMDYYSTENDNSRVRDCVIQCSTDGISFTDVCVTNIPPSPALATIEFDNSIYAQYWRLKILSNNGNTANVYAMKIQFYGTKANIVSGFEIAPIKSYGTYTITATNGTDTATIDVLVDSAVAYNVEISYRNIDENIVLLIDGNNIEDISTYQRAITNTGVTLSDAQTKFFDKSLYFNGSAILQFDAYTLGTGDFTIDFWMYNTSTSNAFRRWITGNNLGFTSGTFCLREHGDGVFQTQNVVSSTRVPRNQWFHAAVVRYNGTLRIYFNGAEIASVSDSTNYSEALKYIGGYNSSIGNETFQGYMDEIRISNVARWTSNFTPPTRPY